MKAVVLNGYGSTEHLKLMDVQKPKIKDTEVLIKVIASSVNAGDLFGVMGSPYMIRFSIGFPRPKDFILGWDISGIIEEVGSKVEGFKAGDEVYGASESAFAEYVKIDANKINYKPRNISHIETASLPTAALTALQRLRDGGKIKKGQKVLVTGASGGVGSFAVQIAKTYGTEVTGVCSAKKIDMVRSIGADHIIDHSRDDITKGNRNYDIILDNVGCYSFSEMKKVLAPGGIIVPNTGHGGMKYVFGSMFQMMLSKKVGGMKVTVEDPKDLNFLKDLIETNKIKPVVDKTFPMDDTAKALDYLKSRKVKGKVVIKIGEEKDL